MILRRTIARLATAACLAAVAGCANMPFGGTSGVPTAGAPVQGWAAYAAPMATNVASLANSPSSPTVVRGQTPPGGYDPYATAPAQLPAQPYPGGGYAGGAFSNGAYVPPAGNYPQAGQPAAPGYQQSFQPAIGGTPFAPLGPSGPPNVYSGPASAPAGTYTQFNQGGLPPAGTLPPPSNLPAPGTLPAPGNYQPPASLPPTASPPPGYPAGNLPPPPGYGPSPFGPPSLGPTGGLPPLGGAPPPGGPLGLPGNFANINAMVQEARTGKLMFGVGVNSSAGLTGQFVIDERNFDITRIPTSFSDFVNGSAFRGAGQGFRLEAMPGAYVQRYLLSFTEPYLFNTYVSLNVSGFLFTRIYPSQWNEQRLGGRVSLGRQLTPDLSLSLALRAEQVQILNPQVLGVPEIDAVLGKNALYSGRMTLSHDTRDVQFAPTSGHLIQLNYEQVFGSFDFPRGEVDLRRYFLLRQRPDGSGRHTLSLSTQLGVSGSQTPVFENFFAGGFSTIRGFYFRRASPQDMGVVVGGPFQLLGSVEYRFPLTADDMFKGVLFVDSGTVEPKVEVLGRDFRVAPGFGFRINVPMMGPAPLAFDFAFPVHRAPYDRIQIFNFFMGMGR